MFPSCLLHQPSNQTKLFSPYPNSFILPKLLIQRKLTHFVPLSQPPKRNPNSFLPFWFFTTEFIEETFELFFFSIVEFDLRKKGMLDFLSSFSFSFHLYSRWHSERTRCEERASKVVEGEGEGGSPFSSFLHSFLLPAWKHGSIFTNQEERIWWYLMKQL